MLLARIGDNIHQIAAITQFAQLLEREERRAGEISFHAQHAIEFNRMSNRLVDLKSELRIVQNDRECAFRTLISFVQGNGLFADATRILYQLEFVD